MKEYLEKYLKRKINIEEYSSDIIPLMYNGLFRIFLCQADGFEWMMAEPKEQMKLRDLRKHILQLEKYTGKDCAFCFQSVSSYIADALLDEGIAFIVLGKHIYLPFAGIMTKTIKRENNIQLQGISFLTQKIILSALYDRWNGMTAAKVADEMAVTRAAISKSFNEIEYLNIPIIETQGRTRVIKVGADVKSIWEMIRPVLRNPVLKRFELCEVPKQKYLAGISALSEYSMLNDNIYPTYGVQKREIRGVIDNNLAGPGDDVCCEVLELGYTINFKGKKVMDPLSVVLSLTDKEKTDERIRQAITEMLEEYVW